jgi:hypothetical protein
VRALAWSAFKRCWEEEDVEQGLDSRYGEFCEEAEDGSEDDVPEAAMHGKSNHESNRTMPDMVGLGPRTAFKIGEMVSDLLSPGHKDTAMMDF